ncbi:hypothetical protein FB45DRAFT_1037937 [Roridomyces roridus]|uniref:Ribonuclease H1 N-terminal domain-containing protein n=1 Tax=Roridomyces roridus TaxID=1738132 RepID=A0AAD7B4E5_9AGAR|nr:hypothetical protein FB45DRAFT_1037937 [Roridomyces roridus]
MHHGLDAAFQQLALVDEPIYFGDLNVKHRRDAVFYVVIRGFVPGVYDTWAEAGPQVTGYSGNIHNKCRGWKAAVAAWNKGFRDLGLVPPSASSVASVTHPSMTTTASTFPPSSSTPSTPSTARHMATPPPVNAPSTPLPRHRATAPGPSTPAPSPMPSRGPALFVVSGGKSAAIYMDRDTAVRAARGRVADGSLRAVDVTTSVRRAFNSAEASVRDCIVISSDEEKRRLNPSLSTTSLTAGTPDVIHTLAPSRSSADDAMERAARLRARAQVAAHTQRSADDKLMRLLKAGPEGRRKRKLAKEMKQGGKAASISAKASTSRK